MVYSKGQTIKLTEAYQADLKRVGYWCERDNLSMTVDIIYTPRVLAAQYADGSRRIVHIDNVSKTNG